METREKAVVRFLSGHILKGYIRDFSPGDADVHLEEAEAEKNHIINSKDLKAIFIVKTFEGDPEYKENKAYGIRKPRGKRVFIKFKDGEIMIGFLEGSVPWEKGFFLYRSQGECPGFFLVPADEGSNNLKTYVIAHSVDDVTIVP